jgi:ribosomal-protein-serine acetyltransferase
MFQLVIDQNLHVQSLHPDDADELFQLLERNRPRLRPWIHPSALPETAEAARKFTIECFFNSLDSRMNAMLEYQEYFQELEHYFPLMNPPMELGIWWNGSLVGEILLSRLQDSYTAAEFGYWIDGGGEGQGIVTRCVSALMDYAIENMGIERFVIGCAACNQRSRAVPERLGYRLHATVTKGEVVGEFIYDRVIYGIRSTVWRERNRSLA